MTAEQMRTVREAVPLLPFDIHLAGGRVLSVSHRDFISQSPRGRIVIVYGPDDSFSIVDLYLVNELVVKPPAPAAESAT